MIGSIVLGKSRSSCRSEWWIVVDQEEKKIKICRRREGPSQHEEGRLS
jgi:hypothetical protein